MNVQTNIDRAKNADHKLFEPYRLGLLGLANRIVMAPLTRNRAALGNVPSSLAVKYCAQRASAGLIITEATQVSLQGSESSRSHGTCRYNAKRL